METLRRETVEHVLRAALLAPRLDPSPPCAFTWHEGILQVSLDPGQQRDVPREATRRLLISAGAAVEHARVAARGLSLGVTCELMPSTRFLASLAFSLGAAPDARELELAAALVDRHVAVGGRRPGPLPEEVIDVLRVAAAAEGAGLRAIHPIQDTVALDLITRLQLGTGGQAEPSRSAVVVALLTSSDGPRDWLVAGSGFGIVTLTAAVYGVLAEPVSQATEPQSRRARLRSLLGMQGTPQLVLHLSQTAAPLPRQATQPIPTSRAPVGEMLAE